MACVQVCIGPDGGYWTQHGPIESPIGHMVKFSIPSLHGKSTIAGTVKRVMPDGRIEVRAQQGGYHTINPSETLA